MNVTLCELHMLNFALQRGAVVGILLFQLDLALFIKTGGRFCGNGFLCKEILNATITVFKGDKNGIL